MAKDTREGQSPNHDAEIINIEALYWRNAAAEVA